MSSFFGNTIKASKNQLEYVLGSCNTLSLDDKTNYEWEVKVSNILFYIYDWKEYRNFEPNEVIEWHIGADNKEESLVAAKYINNLLNPMYAEFKTAINNLHRYVKTNNLQTLVLGISGGVDSAVCAAICSEIPVQFIGRSLPTKFNKKEEILTANLVGEAFCNNYNEINLTYAYRRLAMDITMPEPYGNKQTPVSYGNIQARLRMIYLYNLAGINNGIVIDTDNRTENNLGFFTIHGDVGDYKPIGNLWKTEVFKLATWMVEYYNCLGEFDKANAIQESLKLKPTSGLGITDTDLEEIGAESYEQVDTILKEILSWKTFTAETIWNLKNFLDDQQMLNIPIEIIKNVATRHFNTEFKRK